MRRMGWLRAAVLGANDGLISTSSLVVGVAAATPEREAVLVAGLAGLVSGALSMAAGEYVSVSTQSDAEEASLVRERHALETETEFEHAELADIYVKRGLTPELAEQVADQLMAHDAFGAHVRDDLGILEHNRARPVQAALASASSFALGALLPVSVVAWVPLAQVTPAVIASSLVLLALLGSVAARLGHASVPIGAARVTFWGVMAMTCSALVGRLFE